MQLTLFFDLSFRATTLMAMGEPGRRYAATEMTESLNTSRTHISEVTPRLMEFGFLDAVKGRNGGIYLRDSATDKSIDKPLRTLENNKIVDYVGTDCPLLPTYLLRGKLAAAQEAFFAVPGPVLIADPIPIKPIDGADGDTPEGDNVPKGSMLSIRPVQVQSRRSGRGLKKLKIVLSRFFGEVFDIATYTVQGGQDSTVQSSWGHHWAVIRKQSA